MNPACRVTSQASLADHRRTYRTMAVRLALLAAGISAAGALYTNASVRLVAGQWTLVPGIDTSAVAWGYYKASGCGRFAGVVRGIAWTRCVA